MNLPAQLHWPQGPVAGQETNVAFTDVAMEWAVEGRPKSVPYERVQLRRGGLNESQWQFFWTEPEGHWQIALSVDSAKTLANDPPAGLAAHFAAARSTRRKRRRLASVGWTLLTLFLFLPVILLLLLWWQGDRVAGWIIQRIPVEQEARLGRQMHSMMRANWSEVSGGPAVDAVRTIGEKLTRGSPYTYEWHVVRDSTMNAFAIPGGVVVVHTGLIEKVSRAEELAGVLAHEVQHVERRHSLKQLARGIGWRAAWALTTGDLGGAATLAADLGELSFSRDHESEADRLGMEAMRHAAIDPQGMVDVMEKLAGESGLEIPFLQSHPATKERLAKLEEKARSLPSQTYQALAIDWSAVTRSLRDGPR